MLRATDIRRLLTWPVGIATGVMLVGVTAPPAISAEACSGTPSVGTALSCITPGVTNVPIQDGATSVDVVAIGGGGGGGFAGRRQSADSAEPQACIPHCTSQLRLMRQKWLSAKKQWSVRASVTAFELRIKLLCLLTIDLGRESPLDYTGD